MLIRNRRYAIAVLALSCGLAVTACKERPIEKAGGQTIDLAQAPAPVKATIDQQAKGRAVSELEKHTDKGVT